MKFTINVIQEVEVEIDETKVDSEFLEDFSGYMWHVDDISEIATHVARHTAMYPDYSCEGVPSEFYTAKVVDGWTEEA